MRSKNKKNTGKAKKRKNLLYAGISGVGSYFLYKLPGKTIDPYARLIMLMVPATGLFFHPDQEIKFIATGMMAGTAISSAETLIFEGGKIVRNELDIPLYVIGNKTSGIHTVPPFHTPSFRIDGLSFQGLNGVFKVANGVYIKILPGGNIKETSFFAKIANCLDKGGLKNQQWCRNMSREGDPRWLELYQKSLS